MALLKALCWALTFIIRTIGPLIGTEPVALRFQYSALTNWLDISIYKTRQNIVLPSEMLKILIFTPSLLNSGRP